MCVGGWVVAGRMAARVKKVAKLDSAVNNLTKEAVMLLTKATVHQLNPPWARPSPASGPHIAAHCAPAPAATGRPPAAGRTQSSGGSMPPMTISAIALPHCAAASRQLHGRPGPAIHLAFLSCVRLAVRGAGTLR